jgi:hypothetical protein
LADNHPFFNTPDEVGVGSQAITAHSEECVVLSSKGRVYDYEMVILFLAAILLFPFALYIPALPQFDDSDRVLVQFHPGAQKSRLSAKNRARYGQKIPASVRAELEAKISRVDSIIRIFQP